MTSRGLPSYSTCVLKAEPGKLDIERREVHPGILFISLPVVSLQTSDYDVIFETCVDSASLASDVIQKVQRHHDIIKAHAVR